MSATRREVIRGMGAIAGVALTSRGSAVVDGFGQAVSQNDPLNGDRLYADAVSYTGLGGHRTGTTVDMKTSEWILGELKQSGFAAEYLEFAARRVFDLKTCNVQVDGVSYAGDPEWFPTATGSTPVRAPMAMLADGTPLDALKGRIWMLEDPLGGIRLNPALHERVNQAGKAGALAAIVAINNPSGELVGRGVPPELNERPWCSIPLVGVAYKHRDALLAAAVRNTTAAVIVDGDDKPGVRPRNAMGRIGSGNDLIVVTTPISAFTQAGGERAPGVALFLGLARWLGQRGPKCRYIFSANSGHETGGTGAYALLDVLPPPKDIKAWLHLGATISNWNVRMAGFPTDREAVKRRAGIPSFVADASLLPLLEKAFASIPDARPRAGDSNGELATYLRQGYRAFGFYGSSPVFHTWADDAKQTGPELLEPVGRALARSLELIEGMA